MLRKFSFFPRLVNGAGSQEYLMKAHAKPAVAEHGQVEQRSSREKLLGRLR